MNGNANKRYNSDNFDNGIGNFNPNFFNPNDPNSAAINFGYQFGKQ